MKIRVWFNPGRIRMFPTFWIILYRNERRRLRSENGRDYVCGSVMRFSRYFKINFDRFRPFSIMSLFTKTISKFRLKSNSNLNLSLIFPFKLEITFLYKNCTKITFFPRFCQNFYNYLKILSFKVRIVLSSQKFLDVFFNFFQNIHKSFRKTSNTVIELQPVTRRWFNREITNKLFEKIMLFTPIEKLFRWNKKVGS